MANDAPNTETPPAAARPAPGAPGADRAAPPGADRAAPPNADRAAAPGAGHGQQDAEHDGEHEIAGFRVGVNPIPFSVTIILVFIFLIAVVSWIPVYGF